MAAQTERDIPTISRTLPDGRLVELVFDPLQRSTALAVQGPDGQVGVVPSVELDDGARLVPYSADNNLIATGCVLLPSAVGTLTDKATLLGGVTAFLHRYVDLAPTFEAIAAHYVLMTWVYDAFHEVPYLRFRGDYGTGKTRALLAIGSLCYKPFFASGASTVSPIFHILDVFGGTLILDEADFRFSDASTPLVKILNNGNVRGLPVLRTMSNRNRELNPRAFSVFGPKLVAMRERFSDAALESRFLTEETGARAMRADIPIQVPASLREEATLLRNKLLAWRFAHATTTRTLPEAAAIGVDPRINQMALSLLSLVDDLEVRRAIQDELKRQQAKVTTERAHSAEADVLRAIFTTHARSAGGVIPVAAVAAEYNATARPERPMSAKAAGWFIRERLMLRTARARGVYVVEGAERERLAALALRYGLVDAPTEGASA